MYIHIIIKINNSGLVHLSAILVQLVYVHVAAARGP